ncbi:hypothetical protein F5X99DRAFT_367608, partial [Biscogniauxia marginata]
MACGPQCELDIPVAYGWCLLCACMLVTAMRAQDLYDQEGDKAHRRAMAPLVLGHLGYLTARWSIAICISTWSLAMPANVGNAPASGLDRLCFTHTPKGHW